MGRAILRAIMENNALNMSAGLAENQHGLRFGLLRGGRRPQRAKSNRR
jgi:hypothetical protein